LNDDKAQNDHSETVLSFAVCSCISVFSH